MKKKLYERIGSSLRYGIVFTKHWYIAIYFFICICALIPLSSVGYLIEGWVTRTKFTISDILCAVLYPNLVALICLGIVTVPLIMKNKLKKRIFLWLDDAIELDAKTVELDSRYTRLLFKETKLKVEFKFDRQHIVLTSEQPDKPCSLFNYRGYRRDLTKYANKKVKILYSPKYDEVLFLKMKYQ